MFSEAVNISNIEIDYDILPQGDNVWMSFTTGTSTYKNLHEIPFIINNKYPKINIFDSTNTITDYFTLKAVSDGLDTQDYFSIEINDSIFRLSLPSLQPGEEISHIYDIIIDSVSYTNFSYFIDSQDIFIKLDGTDFTVPKDITLDFEISNNAHLTQQFVGTYDFQALAQGNYTLVGEFYDISATISIYNISSPFKIDFEGPSIYSQFNNGFSVDPTSGDISFIIKDSSDIISYQFNVSLAGSWIIDKDNYTFIFNDNTLVEGINNYQLICEDSLNFISTKDFSLNLDKSAPAISNIYSDSNPWNGIFLIKIDIDDISPYSVSLKCINTVSGVIYDSLDISFITTEMSSTKTEWQILLDTNQLLNGKYDIIVTVIDEAAISAEISLLDYYFDNSAPDLTLVNNDIYAEGSVVYSIEPAETLYLSDQEFISIFANDELFDGFNWATTSYPYLEQRLGIEAVTMYHTKPLSYHDINLGTLSYDSLVYEIIDYDLGNTNIDRIKSIQKIKIGAEEIDKFTVYLIGSSLYIEIDEEYRFLLSSSSQVQALFYELEPQGISLTFDSNNIKWLLETLAYGYFDISYHLPGINQGSQFLFWFTVEDGLKNIVGSEGNQFISREYKGIYDNLISGTPTFEWNLGETSSSEGILIFGSENYGDSTIEIDISSVLFDENSDVDVQRIIIYGSNDGIIYTLLGRAYFSDDGVWSYYWDYELGLEDPVDYYIKAYVFDKAGNYITITHDAKLYDYNAIVLITDLVFGDIVEYDDSLPSNIYDFTGTFYLQNTPLNLWDVVAQYYSPIENNWVPLYSDPTVIQTSGPNDASYTITWDINQDIEFMYTMYNFTYEFLPLRVTPTTSNNIWGSWGIFDLTGEWKPIILLDTASQIDIVIYEFDAVNGWIVDTALSSQDPISVVAGETFKIFDLDGDGIDEIVRVSPSQVDVIYLDQSSNWIVKQDVINNPELQYSIFDLTFNDVINETTMVLFQLNLTSGSIDIGKYYFDAQFNLIQIQKPVTFVSNLIPNSINIVEDMFSTISVLVGTITSGTSLSQLIHYDFNLENENILDDSILGRITSIEAETINGIKTIVLGVSREFIGKMDTVICLRFNDELDSWVEYEINDFDENRLKIYDMIFINDNSLNKLIISSDSGLFRSTIEYTEEEIMITEPIKFTSKVYSKSELSDYKLSGIFRFIITGVDETPISQVNKIYYKNSGTWYELTETLYYISHSRLAFDLQLDSSIWNALTDLKIAYSYISNRDEIRKSIDPSFNTYSSTSTIQDISVSSRYFDGTSLPLLWLNPTSTIIDPFADWRSLGDFNTDYRGLNYRYTPVSSGLGTSVLYPTRTYGWANSWGTEYTNMPELENSLIYYGDDNSYDSGILSQYLTGQDDFLADDEFDGQFKGNYLESAYISNPVISESFDFSELYYSNIHTDTGGIYDEVGSVYDNDVLVRNRMTDLDFSDFNDVGSGISQSGAPIASIYQDLQSSTLDEIEHALSGWNDYLSLYMDSESTFGAEFTYKLPLIDRTGLESIQVAFDASISSTSFGEDYPLSLRIYNYETPGWESLPLASLTGVNYDTRTLDYDFWSSWDDLSVTPSSNGFRPSWGTVDSNNINTISYGVNYPYITIGSNMWFYTPGFDPSLGASFFVADGSENHDLNTYWSFVDDNGGEHHKVLFYDTSFNSNKFQFDNLIIDPDNFYTSLTPFPEYDSSTIFSLHSSNDFYDNYLNDGQELTLQLLVEKEGTNPSNAHLCIGDFKTYVHTDSNYLNYEDFDSNSILTLPMQHVSDAIDLTSTGLELKGESGFNLKQEFESIPIFHETFEGSSWILDSSGDTIYINNIPTDDANVHRNSQGGNWGDGDSSVISVRSYDDWAWIPGIGVYWPIEIVDNGLIKYEYPYLDLGYTSDSTLSYYGTAPGDLAPIDIYHTTDFDEDTVTWGNQPLAGAFQTQINPLLGRQEQSIGSPSPYYKLTQPLMVEYDDYSFKFTSKEGAPGQEPYIKHYLSKFYQGDGIAYMQTDINENLDLRSPIYPTAINMETDDVFVIEFKTTSTNEIKLNLYGDNGVTKLPIDYEIVPDSNTNFNKQILYIPVSGPITFDRLEFTGNLDDPDFFMVYDIKAFSQGETQGMHKDSRSYDFIEQITPSFPLLNYGSTVSGGPSSAHLSDNDYWSIDSTNNQINIDFLFEGEYSVQDLDKLEVSFEATSNDITLDGNTEFSYYNYILGDFAPLSGSLIDNVFILTLLNDDFDTIKDPIDSQYKLLLKITITDNNPFNVLIDSLTMKALEVWSAEHDLYKASFEFTPLNDNGEIRLFINRDIYTTINDSQYTKDQINIVSFYYDVTAKEWYIYLDDDDDLTPAILLLGPINDPNPMALTPRIESHFTSNLEGISVHKITSQYFMKVETQNDFENYKTLVNSYKEGSFTDSLNIDSLDSLLIPENTFSQISSDIDIIYDFIDGITENNIFSENLVHTGDSSDSDSLITTPYNYREEVVLPYSNINYPKTYVTDYSGDVVVTEGDVIDLQSSGGGDFKVMRGGYTSVMPPGFYPPFPPAEGFDPNLRGFPQEPTFTASTPPMSDHLEIIGSNYGFSFDDVDPYWNLFDDDWTDHYALYTNALGQSTNMYEYMKFSTNYDGSNPTSIYFEFEITVDILGDIDSGAYLEIKKFPDSPSEDWELVRLVFNDNTEHWYAKTYSAGVMENYLDANGDIEIRLHTWNQHTGGSSGFINVEIDKVWCIVEYLPFSEIVFEAGTPGNNYYLFYGGETSGISTTMDFYDGTTPLFQVGSIYNREAMLVTDFSQIHVTLAESLEGWFSNRKLYNDYLYLVDINQNTNVPVYNSDLVSIDSSLSKSSNAVQEVWLEDPFLGLTLMYTIENTINTPIFGRNPEQIYTQLELDTLKLDFEVYPQTDNTLLEDLDIEGKDTDVVDPQFDYSSDRFRNGAIDDASIPLITPIELDFGQIDTEGLSNIDLEIALDFDISLDYRSVSSPDWEWRPRVMIYDYTTSTWKDFTGMIWASVDQGTPTKVWELDFTYPAVSNLHYLQYPNTHQNLFLQIGDSSQIEITVTEENLNIEDFLPDGKIKLALLSYIIPGNFNDVGTGNYLHYDREDAFTPISVSQSIDIRESALLLETRNILYSESVFTATLTLDSNYEADLSQLDPTVGEVVLVKGISEVTPTLTEEYPLFNLFDFEVRDIQTQPYIEITSAMRSEFTKIYIEYIPQLSLVSGPPWYLPSEYTKDSITYEAPFFISEVMDDTAYYGTYIHPTFPVGFTIEPPGGGQLYVDFTLPPGNNPRGAIHYAKIDGLYSNRFAIKDELLFNYDLLESPIDLSGGRILLTLKSGFNDIMDGTELTQITANDYYVTVKLYKRDLSGALLYIGEILQPINSPTLGFSQHNLEIDLRAFESVNGLQDIGDALTQGYGNDLYVTVEATISNCLVDAHLFRGHFAQQILDARIEIETGNTALLYNNFPASTPYIELNHDNLQLNKIDDTTFQFNTLKYNFDFDVIEVRTETGTILSSADYYFNSFDNTITFDYEYSGLLFADINYHAFEWDVDSISTLEPITISFNGDYISRYTSYLELEIEYNFDGIPGFEIMNLDTSSGRVVMTNEKKNAKLLKIFLYNYQTETYDFIDCVVYDNYGGSNNFLPTFSYIIDRNFIVFEDYFNDLGSTFDISFILAVDESFDNYFASKINFGINSISAKIYHDPPSIKQFLNPQIIFDVDLSEYYSTGSIDLDEISIEFDYLSTILNDESSIFSQYALINEDIIFSIQNKYLEFEPLTLENSKISFSREEFNDFLIYNKENDKYFIRLRLEYEWSCIIKVNLGGTSRIEILSSVQLVKYNLDVKYTSTETERISAFESSNPHDLAVINAPNYVETDVGIVVFPDDSEVDIGINSGFLRNIDTRQRLMIRQDLSYDFPDSQLSPISVLVDQSYSDTILRFTKPIGYL
ncbi:hypothetical protein LCGC14_0664460, partial [marine sediment metagenome]